MTNASAPGKIILFGEHAVVYARPAIAVPVLQVRAEATIEPSRGDDVAIDAPDVARAYILRDAPDDDPLAAIIRLTCVKLGVEPHGFTVRVRSTIPVARGLGSGAAVSVAVARALNKFFATGNTDASRTEKIKKIFVREASVPSVAELSSDEISALAYEVEKLHHGTPSGIDNTVIAFEQPVYFVRDEPIQSFRVARPFTIVIADTGIPAPTKIAVGDVRRAWQADRARYESLFDQVGAIVREARMAIEQGNVDALGALMNANQKLLREIGVSSPEIETLVDAAIRAGARGAKLSGAGRGGNVIVLVDAVTQDEVEHAMLDAGARGVVVTKIQDPKGSLRGNPSGLSAN